MYKRKNEIEHFYDVTPIIDMEHFTEILINMLASKSKITDLKDLSIKTAELPINYKQTIEEIMFNSNGWPMKFSKVIDIHKYYEDQALWEMDFASSIDSYLKNNNKKLEYDFIYDRILIKYTKGEINKNLEKYDEDVQNIMDHFSNLVVAFSDNRQYDLRVRDIKNK